MTLEEKISLTAGRDGGLHNLEVHGLLTLKITDEKYGKIKVGIANNDKKGMQLQVGLRLLSLRLDSLIGSIHDPEAGVSSENTIWGVYFLLKVNKLTCSMDSHREKLMGEVGFFLVWEELKQKQVGIF